MANYLTTYRRCNSCGKSSNMPAGAPMRCISCDKELCVHCTRCGYCSTCWNKLTPDEQKWAKEKWKKGIKKGLLQVIIGALFLFFLYGLPIYMYNGNDRVIIPLIIGETIGLFVVTLLIINHYRKKRGQLGLFEEMRRDFQRAPSMTNKDKSILKKVCCIFSIIIIVVAIIAYTLIEPFL